MNYLKEINFRRDFLQDRIFLDVFSRMQIFCVAEFFRIAKL